MSFVSRLHTLGTHSGYTAKAKDWKIDFTEQFLNKPDALARENNLKAGRIEED
jgi:predicted GIY-YIG superfamily endonuclease